MKFVHSAAILSQVHSNIWMMTFLVVPTGARESNEAPVVAEDGADSTAGSEAARRERHAFNRIAGMKGEREGYDRELQSRPVYIRNPTVRARAVPAVL